jgi:hypothetical protein
MKKKKRSFWDVLAWVALAFIIIWLLLKTFGIINTPLWLTYSPLYAAAYIVGWQVHKLEALSSEFKGFRTATVNKIHNIEQNCLIKHNK